MEKQSEIPQTAGANRTVSPVAETSNTSTCKRTMTSNVVLVPQFEDNKMINLLALTKDSLCNVINPIGIHSSTLISASSTQTTIHQSKVSAKEIISDNGLTDKGSVSPDINLAIKLTSPDGNAATKTTSTDRNVDTDLLSTEGNTIETTTDKVTPSPQTLLLPIQTSQLGQDVVWSAQSTRIHTREAEPLGKECISSSSSVHRQSPECATSNSEQTSTSEENMVSATGIILPSMDIPNTNDDKLMCVARTTALVPETFLENDNQSSIKDPESPDSILSLAFSNNDSDEELNEKVEINEDSKEVPEIDEEPKEKLESESFYMEVDEIDEESQEAIMESDNESQGSIQNTVDQVSAKETLTSENNQGSIQNPLIKKFGSHGAVLNDNAKIKQRLVHAELKNTQNSSQDDRNITEEISTNPTVTDGSIKNKSLIDHNDYGLKHSRSNSNLDVPNSVGSNNMSNPNTPEECFMSNDDHEDGYSHMTVGRIESRTQSSSSEDTDTGDESSTPSHSSNILPNVPKPVFLFANKNNKNPNPNIRSVINNILIKQDTKVKHQDEVKPENIMTVSKSHGKQLDKTGPNIKILGMDISSEQASMSTQTFLSTSSGTQTPKLIGNALYPNTATSLLMSVIDKAKEKEEVITEANEAPVPSMSCKEVKRSLVPLNLNNVPRHWETVCQSKVKSFKQYFKPKISHVTNLTTPSRKFKQYFKPKISHVTTLTTPSSINKISTPRTTVVTSVPIHKTSVNNSRLSMSNVSTTVSKDYKNYSNINHTQATGVLLKHQWPTMSRIKITTALNDTGIPPPTSSKDSIIKYPMLTSKVAEINKSDGSVIAAQLNNPNVNLKPYTIKGKMHPNNYVYSQADGKAIVIVYPEVYQASARPKTDILSTVPNVLKASSISTKPQVGNSLAVQNVIKAPSISTTPQVGNSSAVQNVIKAPSISTIPQVGNSSAVQNVIKAPSISTIPQVGNSSAVQNVIKTSMVCNEPGVSNSSTVSNVINTTMINIQPNVGISSSVIMTSAVSTIPKVCKITPTVGSVPKLCQVSSMPHFKHFSSPSLTNNSSTTSPLVGNVSNVITMPVCQTIPLGQTTVPGSSYVLQKSPGSDGHPIVVLPKSTNKGLQTEKTIDQYKDTKPVFTPFSFKGENLLLMGKNVETGYTVIKCSTSTHAAALTNFDNQERRSVPKTILQNATNPRVIKVEVPEMTILHGLKTVVPENNQKRPSVPQTILQNTTNQHVIKVEVPEMTNLHGLKTVVPEKTSSIAFTKKPEPADTQQYLHKASSGPLNTYSVRDAIQHSNNNAIRGLTVVNNNVGSQPEMYIRGLTPTHSTGTLSVATSPTSNTKTFKLLNPEDIMKTTVSTMTLPSVLSYRYIPSTAKPNHSLMVESSSVKNSEQKSSKVSLIKHPVLRSKVGEINKSGGSVDIAAQWNNPNVTPKSYSATMNLQAGDENKTVEEDDRMNLNIGSVFSLAKQSDELNTAPQDDNGMSLGIGLVFSLAPVAEQKNTRTKRLVENYRDEKLYFSSKFDKTVSKVRLSKTAKQDDGLRKPCFVVLKKLNKHCMAETHCSPSCKKNVVRRLCTKIMKKSHWLKTKKQNFKSIRSSNKTMLNQTTKYANTTSNMTTLPSTRVTQTPTYSNATPNMTNLRYTCVSKTTTCSTTAITSNRTGVPKTTLCSSSTSKATTSPSTSVFQTTQCSNAGPIRISGTSDTSANKTVTDGAGNKFFVMKIDNKTVLIPSSGKRGFETPKAYVLDCTDDKTITDAILKITQATKCFSTSPKNNPVKIGNISTSGQHTLRRVSPTNTLTSAPSAFITKSVRTSGATTVTTTTSGSRVAIKNEPMSTGYTGETDKSHIIYVKAEPETTGYGEESEPTPNKVPRNDPSLSAESAAERIKRLKVELKAKEEALSELRRKRVLGKDKTTT